LRKAKDDEGERGTLGAFEKAPRPAKLYQGLKLDAPVPVRRLIRFTKAL